MSDSTGKTIAVSVIWLSTAAICIFAPNTMGWVLFVAAGTTSYYIWSWDTETSRGEKEADKIEELKRWNELREKGIISQAEFDAKKSDLMD